jgi:hypothetical protein
MAAAGDAPDDDDTADGSAASVVRSASAVMARAVSGDKCDAILMICLLNPL